MQIHVLEQGHIEARSAPFVSETGGRIRIDADWPVRCYLIRHPAGDLLWDTGMPEEALAGNPDALGGMRKHIDNPLDEWLKQFGLSTSEIPLVGLSHMHVDHGGNVNRFPKSRFLIAGVEYDAAIQPEVGTPYYPRGYDRLKADQVNRIAGVTDVFGDGAVVIHPAPGHSIGHQVLLVSEPGRQPLLLMGDAAYVPGDLTVRRAPIWNVDFEATFRTMDDLIRLAAVSGARMLFHHDPDSVV